MEKQIKLVDLIGLANNVNEVVKPNPPINVNFEITGKGSAKTAQEMKAVKAVMADLTDVLFKDQSEDGTGSFLVKPADIGTLTPENQEMVKRIAPDEEAVWRLFPEANGKKNGGGKKKAAPKPEAPKKPTRGSFTVQAYLDGLTEKDPNILAADKRAVAAGLSSNEKEAAFQYSKVRELMSAIAEYGFQVVKK